MNFINPKSLLIPNSFQEMIMQCKLFRAAEFRRISCLSFIELSECVKISYKFVQATPSTADHQQIVKACYIINCLRKLCPDKKQLLIQEVTRLNNDRNQQVTIFISYITAQLYNNIEGSKIRQRIEYCRNRTENTNDFSSPYFIYFLAKYSPKSVLLNSPLFLDVATRYIYSQSMDIQIIAEDTIRIFFQILIKTPEASVERSAKILFGTANSFKTIYYGSIHIFTILLENKFYYLFKDYEYYFNSFNIYLHSKDMKISNYSLYNMILLAPINFEYFKTKYWTNIERRLTDLLTHKTIKPLQADIFLKLTERTEFFQLFTSDKIINCLNAMLNFSPGPMKQGFILLDTIAKKNADMINKYYSNISSFLSSITKFNDDYLECIPKIMNKFPRLWDDFRRRTLIPKSKTDLKNPTLILLKIIAKCPPINAPEITSLLMSLLTHSDPLIRGYSPQAFFQNCHSIKHQEIIQYISRLLKVCLNEMNSQTRALLLQSFPPHVHKYLFSQDSLRAFNILANDECFEVKENVVLLLAQINELSPFGVNPILRRILLDDLFLLYSPQSHRLRNEMTKLLLALITAAKKILPIYAPVICQIALDHFTAPQPTDMTYFESKSYNEISLNLTKAIDIIAKQATSLISSNYLQFIESFIYVLQLHNMKDLKIAYLHALTTLISNCPPEIRIDRKKIHKDLTSIASKWSSRKLNVAFLKLLGCIGAVDQEEVHDPETAEYEEINRDHDAYYFTIVCKALLFVLKDETLCMMHCETIRILVDIFSNGDKSGFQYFMEFMPLFLQQIRQPKNSELLKLLQRLCLSAPPKWLTCFSEDLISLIYELWGTSSLYDVLGVVPSLASVLLDRFAPFLPQCITLLLDCLFSNRTNHPEIAKRVLESFIALRWVSNDFIFLIVPEIISTASFQFTELSTRIEALDALRIIIQSCDCSNFSAAIMRCVVTCLSMNDGGIVNNALQVLYSLQVSLGSNFAAYQEMATDILQKRQIPMNDFRNISGAVPPLVFNMFDFIKTGDRLHTTCLKNQKFYAPSAANPIEDAVKFSEEDTPWNRKEWFKKFVDSFISNSPASCISLSSSIAREIKQVSEALFNPAFLSCWEKMAPETKNIVREAITDSLKSQHLSGNARSIIVSLIEFMDKAECSTGISDELLCISCLESGHHAKSSLFAHKWFSSDPCQESKDAMISLASTLGLHKTVVGMSKVFADGPAPPKWSEMLGDWKQALIGYEKENNVVGKLRCLVHLMRWKDIVEYYPELEKYDYDSKKHVASSLIIAYHQLQDYRKILGLIHLCAEDDVTSQLYAAIANHKIGNTKEANKLVDKAYGTLAYRAQTMFKHDKSMLYQTLLASMQLTELEELMNNTSDDDVWMQRLKLCRKTFDVYLAVMTVRFSYKQTLPQCLILLKRALKTRDWDMFDALAHQLFINTEGNTELTCLMARSIWERGKCQEALDQVMNIDLNLVEDNKLSSMISFYRGQWNLRLPSHPTDSPPVIIESLPHLKESVKLNPNNYKAWHRMAWASATLFRTSKQDPEYALIAINGFIHCVMLRFNNSFSDLIQMISIIFMANLDQENFDNVAKNIAALGDSHLLKVVPQLFAQLPKEGSRASQFVAELISKMLPHHFHVLLYPLFLLYRDDQNSKAKDLLYNFEKVNPIATKQAEIVSNGLLKCSNSATEHDLEVIVNMLKVAPHRDVILMYEILENGMNESNNSKFTPILSLLRQLKQFYSQKKFKQVIDSMRKLYDDLKTQMKEFKSIKLEDASSELASLKDTILAVPGTYHEGGELITISYFHPVLEVISSKQHPRLVNIYGSDGKLHASLLKGHEDLRLDQHVMQFFDLINMHILNGFPPESRSLKLHCYSITPLSTMSGLIQFLDNTDTLFTLISNYRMKHDSQVFNEQECGGKILAEEEDNLMPIQRLEYLNEVASVTQDNDLQRIIWLKSLNAMSWISRTLRFTQTTAVVSIVGYILGLGDRHPSNIMMHRFSGDVIHIDFGDCFEIGKQRRKFPEAVPFRLTRMIRKAFGPTGIEGDFRITCEQTIKLVRAHHESIMTVLDIFLQVPLEGAESIQVKKTHSVPEAIRESIILESTTMDDDDVPRLNIVSALARVEEKLNGLDFENTEPLSVTDQVSLLISSAMDQYNLSYMYHGWIPLW